MGFRKAVKRWRRQLKTDPDAVKWYVTCCTGSKKTSDETGLYKD